MDRQMGPMGRGGPPPEMGMPPGGEMDEVAQLRQEVQELRRMIEAVMVQGAHGAQRPTGGSPGGGMSGPGGMPGMPPR